MTTAEKLTQIAENQPRLYDAGAAEHFRSYIRICNYSQSYLYAFAGPGWHSNVSWLAVQTYIPAKDMVFDCKVNSSNMYAYSTVKETVATIDLSEASGNAKSTFANANNLVTITKLLVSETTPTLNFSSCTKLENITFEGVLGASVDLSKCKSLRNTSAQNIIDCLKDLTGQTGLTFTLHANVGAALTDAQKAAITAKNWTLVY